MNHLVPALEGRQPWPICLLAASSRRELGIGADEMPLGWLDLTPIDMPCGRLRLRLKLEDVSLQNRPFQLLLPPPPKKPFALSLSKSSPSSSATAPRKGKPFDKLRANGIGFEGVPT